MNAPFRKPSAPSSPAPPRSGEPLRKRSERHELLNAYLEHDASVARTSRVVRIVGVVLFLVGFAVCALTARDLALHGLNLVPRRLISFAATMLGVGAALALSGGRGATELEEVPRRVWLPAVVGLAIGSIGVRPFILLLADLFAP